MKGPRYSIAHALFRLAIFVAVLAAIAKSSPAQTDPVERTFRESKSTVEKALKKLQPAMSGRLPAIEGFALVGDHPLTRYQRAFYQCMVQVVAAPAGGSVVRVSAKVTAWYADPNSSHSGYQLLTSNGRLEDDLLDQLSDQLKSASTDAAGSENQAMSAANEAPVQPRPTAPDEAVPSAPTPGPMDASGSFSPSPGKGLSVQPLSSRQASDANPGQKDLQIETAALEDVLKNQAHPKNLVAVKKSGTPIVASPSLTGKTLFLASEHDEFELLDFNGDWVHVRISGLSRGWIWRTSLEMPEGIPDVPRAVSTSAPTAADIFQVSREESAQFPGDWEPLRGKNVKIISVQKIRENENDGGAAVKLEFAKSLLEMSYNELAKSPELAGLVLIFDSADGGMIAATLPTIQRWKAGTLTDAAMWHQCYFDPPETFTVSSAAAGR